MGGSIGFGIRASDDREIYMDRWTNDLGWRITSPGFLNETSEMEEFFEEAKHENTWPDSRLLTEIVPREYGLVLVDFPSREILSRNDYTTPMKFMVANFSTSFIDTLKNAEQLAKDNSLSGIVHNPYGVDGDPRSITPTEFLEECQAFHVRWEEYQSREKSDDIIEIFKGKQELFKFFNKVIECQIDPKIFRVDHQTDRRIEPQFLQSWLNDHHWKTPMGHWEEELEE